MHYLITGHNGFKGTWLALLLKRRGHQISGVSLNPIRDSLYSKVKSKDLFEHDMQFDIEDSKILSSFVKDISPDYIIHLAAQALVKEGYRNPSKTYSTNVVGTANMLMAIKRNSLKSSLIVTTDKVYKKNPVLKAYTELDELGGEDPYSASKTIADLITQKWILNFPDLRIGIARAGNVIGGGDVAQDRLLPHLIREISIGKPPKLRFPKFIRPWQHVLDCLNGYLLFLDYLAKNNEYKILNFGPYEMDYKSVEDLTDYLLFISNSSLKWQLDTDIHQQESKYLALDSTNAYNLLKWRNKWNFEESVSRTLNWYSKIERGNSPLKACLEDIEAFEQL